MSHSPIPFIAEHGGVRLDGETAGAGATVVLLHGLTATRRYVTMGSRALAKRGYRMVLYDARGHGESSPAPDPARYEYADLSADLLAVLDSLDAGRCTLVGHSMGAATAVRFALDHPERVEALVQVGPAYPGEPRASEEDLAGWDALADGLERDGVEGFLAAYDPPVPESFRDTVMQVARQRLERHRHPEAVAAALRVVPRSAAFDGIEELERIDVPALVVGSRDEPDPGHPLAVAEEYARRLPRAELVVEDEGSSPLAWQGAQLSREIAGFLDRALGGPPAHAQS